MLEKINSVFFEEANDLLEQLEGHLLSLEENPEDKEIIGAVFRIMHTIKGSSGMFGFTAISSFTHEVESTFDMVRNGTAPVTPELISLTLKARDHIRDLLSDTETNKFASHSEELINEFREFMSQYSSDIKPAEKKTETKVAVSSNEQDVEDLDAAPDDAKAEKEEFTWRIQFTPSRGILKNGTRPLLLVKEISEMGTATVVTFWQDVPPLSSLNPEECYMSWNIILTTTASKNEIQDVFIFIDDESKVSITPIEIDTAVHRKIGEILIDREVITSKDVELILSRQKRLGELLVEQKMVSTDQLQSALAEQSHVKNVAQKTTEETPANNQQAQQTAQSIRVSSEKLDMLIDIVGELVTFNARLIQLSHEIKNSNLLTLSEQSERLILSLRDTSMDMRMLPIGTIFSRFRRLVRDLSGELGKNIELVTEGAETELDKTVIEKLNDPLVHLIRNSIDHGIEMPAVREELGKDPQGKVKLIAKHAGAFVLITIQDDGAGLNTEKIKKKAIEKGLITANTELTQEEINELIFAPGFSTAEKVTSVSGRGVGMDVVKKDITALGGTVAIQSKQGVGSSFILKLPLTLAIIEGMLVQIGSGKYVIPLTNVEECLEFVEEKDKDGKTCSFINARGTYLPYINLRTYFEIGGEIPESRQVVVVNDQDSKMGIVVDSVIGNHQTVIKPLGRLYSHIEGLSGATILGDGSVALILDIFKLAVVLKREDGDK